MVIKGGNILVTHLDTHVPTSLFGLCVDFMSWNPNVQYRGSMTLPHSMHTNTQMGELQQLPIENVNRQKAQSFQVTLHNNVQVDLEVKQYLLDQATSRKYTIVLHKLTDNQIKGWQALQWECWEDIDHYSSLEEVQSDSNKSVPSLLADNDTPADMTTTYSLRERKLKGCCST